MKKSPFVFAVATLGLTFAASAYDSDPGYGESRNVERREWYGGRDYDRRPGFGEVRPIYYRPTMRYYGNGYTISYRYIPVYIGERANDGCGAASISSNFRTEAFHIPTDEIPSWGANSPRLTVKDARSGAPRTAITTIIRKTSSGSGKKAGTGASPYAVPADAPVITPAEPAPATTPTPAPVPDAAAPAQPKP